MKLILLLLLILYQVVEQQPCNPNPTNQEAAQVWDYYMKEHHQGKSRLTTPSDPKEIPLNKKAAYGRWLLNFVALKREELASEPKFPINLDKPRHWSVIGGETGQLPPPWAYVSGGYYKPLYCYDHYQKGKCGPKYRQINLDRYGYNSWTDTCDVFNYSGCGGNNNRFIRKQECEDACRSPLTCCDNPVDYPSEYPHYGE